VTAPAGTNERSEPHLRAQCALRAQCYRTGERTRERR